MSKRLGTASNIWITGASSGIGEAVTHALVDQGHRLVITGRRQEALDGLSALAPERVVAARADTTSRDDLQGISSTLETHGDLNMAILNAGTCEYLEIADYDSAVRCVEKVGIVDILINNAGESQAGALEDTSMDAIEKLFTVNVFGPIALTKAVLPGMRERGSGTVVMVGSMLSSFPVAFRSNYAATKSALKAFALAPRREVAPYGIRMISVEPGTNGRGRLVLRQQPFLYEANIDDSENPLVLANDVVAFNVKFLPDGAEEGDIFRMTPLPKGIEVEAAAAGNLPMQHRMCFEPVEADAFDSPEDAGTGARENDGAALQFAPETGPSMSPFTALALLSAAVPARAADRRGGAGSKGARRAILLSDMTESGQDF